MCTEHQPGKCKASLEPQGNAKAGRQTCLSFKKLKYRWGGKKEATSQLDTAKQLEVSWQKNEEALGINNIKNTRSVSAWWMQQESERWGDGKLNSTWGHFLRTEGHCGMSHAQQAPAGESREEMSCGSPRHIFIVSYMQGGRYKGHTGRTAYKQRSGVVSLSPELSLSQRLGPT